METFLTQDILDDLTDSTGVPPISWTPIRASSDCLRTSSSPAAPPQREARRGHSPEYCRTHRAHKDD
jgi:hypothetical protein